MTDYCFTNVVGKLPGLLEKIRDVGVPKKVTVSWLETIGFKSSNDRTLIRPLNKSVLLIQTGFQLIIGFNIEVLAIRPCWPQR